MAWTKDPVRPEQREEVFRRDGGCIAPVVDPQPGPCRSRWGRIVDRTDRRHWTLDHVPPLPGSTRISSARWMVTLCWGHGVISHWETGHRDLERDYLESKHGESVTKPLTGAERITVERTRQIVEEGYGPDHDRGHADELAQAGACYAMPEEVDGTNQAEVREFMWPWNEAYWKPTPGDRIRELEKAGALIAAAIDALIAEQEDPA